MDDNAPKENPPADFNKLDLSQLQGFSFGTQWTQDKASPSDRRDHGDRPRRDDRHDGPGGGAPDRRDRRSFRKPAGAPGSGGAGEGAAPAEAPAGGGAGAPPRREFSGDRRPHGGGGGDYRGGGGGGGGDFRGGPRRDGPGGGRDFRGGGGPRFGGRGGDRDSHQGHGHFERGPYDSPFFNVTFYPEDTSFNTLVQTIRKSCRTIELFEIARTVVAKSDRFVVVVTRKSPEEAAQAQQGFGRRGEPAPAPAPAAEPAPKAPKLPLYISVPDGLPFESDEAAVSHVLSKHLDKFFEMAEVEVEPPKGNFQVINKCGVTGELLGPPNYHRYNQIVQQHYATKVARMPFDAFRSRIETIRDPEAVAQWLAKMKKITRYTWKTPGQKPAAAAPVAAPAAPAEGAPAEAAPEAPAAAEAPAAPAAPVPTFDTLEDARVFLLTQARDKVVRTTESARFPGKVVDAMPQSEIRRAIEGALERQRKFPLDTANALRGRLRREHFTIFKKGSKGVSFVCAVKRKFRVPGQTFSDSIGALISFIEAHPMTRVSELPAKFLGIRMPAPAAATPAAEAGAAPAAPASPEAALSIEDRAKISRAQGDLMWLVREGYVTEFIDGRLFAPPPMVEARKKEVEASEHDPENFPEVPADSKPAPEEAPAAPAEAEPASEAAPEETPSPEAPAAEAPASAEPAPEAAPAAAEEAPASPAPEAAPEHPAPAEEPKPATE